MNQNNAKSIGDKAEADVVRWLESAGVSIVARNLRLGMLEIDIVAREGRVILVVEVRTRGENSWTRAFSSIDHKKRLRIRRAGERLWNRRYRNDSSVDRLRYDVASVRYDGDTPLIEYIQAAF